MHSECVSVSDFAFVAAPSKATFEVNADSPFFSIRVEYPGNASVQKALAFHTQFRWFRLAALDVVVPSTVLYATSHGLHVRKSMTNFTPAGSHFLSKY